MRATLHLVAKPLDTSTVLRNGVLGLAALGLGGTAFELVFLRHWDGIAQLIVWPAIGLLAVGLLALVARPSPRTIRWVQAWLGW